MAETQERAQPTQADWKALDVIIRKANEGDPKALAKLRTFLDENPQVWQHVGDLARTAEKAWITLIANGSSPGGRGDAAATRPAEAGTAGGVHHGR